MKEKACNNPPPRLRGFLLRWKLLSGEVILSGALTFDLARRVDRGTQESSIRRLRGSTLDLGSSIEQPQLVLFDQVLELEQCCGYATGSANALDLLYPAYCKLLFANVELHMFVPFHARRA